MNLPFYCRMLLSSLATVSLAISLSACQMLSTKPSDQEAEARIQARLDSFERTCLNRDINKNPYPKLGSKIHSRVSGVTGPEVTPGSCTFWHIGDETHNVLGIQSYLRNYDPSFITFQRHDYFISELKKRFGVIYHHSGPTAPASCTVGRFHTMLLRDGETVLKVAFVNQERGADWCNNTYWQGYAIQLRHVDTHYGDYDPREAPYILNHLNAVNLERLSDQERRQVSDAWEDSTNKDYFSRKVVAAIETIKLLHENELEQYEASRQSRNEYRAMVRAQKEESQARLNQQIFQAMTSIYSQGDADGRSVNNVTSQQNSRPLVAPSALQSLKGFNTAQLPQSIDRNALPPAVTGHTASGAPQHNRNAPESINLTPMPPVPQSSGMCRGQYALGYVCARAGSHAWYAQNQRSTAIGMARTIAFTDAEKKCSGGRSNTSSTPSTPPQTDPAWVIGNPDCRESYGHTTDGTALIWCEIEVAAPCKTR